MMIRMKHLVMLLLLLVSACASPAAVSSTPQEATQPVETNAQQPTAEAVTAEPLDECVACHTSKEMLIETTEKVEDTAESESKGVG